MRVFDKNNFLKEKNVNIRTTYKDGELIKYRNSDNSRVDSINYGIKLKSEYFKDNKLIGLITGFDSRIIYTFIKNEIEYKEITCKNCSYHDSSQKFIDGCPYCGTYYNIDYDEKSLGNKNTYDYKYKRRSYIVITLLIDFVICFFLTLFYILYTGRTFNFYDMSKVIIVAIIFGLIIFYPLYLLDSLIVLAPIKKLKEDENNKQQLFWEEMNNRNFDKNIFMNNFNYEIMKYVYAMDKAIDYNIEDYNSFEIKYDNDQLYVLVNATIRVMLLEENKIVVKHIYETFTFSNAKKTGELHGGVNIVMCPKCGSSIDVTKNNCQYCGMEINYLQEWYLVN